MPERKNHETREKRERKKNSFEVVFRVKNCGNYTDNIIRARAYESAWRAMTLTNLIIIQQIGNSCVLKHLFFSFFRSVLVLNDNRLRS